MNLMQFKNLCILSTAVLTTSSAFAAKPPENFREAKKEMVKIFKQLEEPTTLYCGCDIVFPRRGGYKPDLSSCGYRIHHDPKRARRIEAEHIMPAWEFGHNLSCWENAERGEGRHTCEETSKLFNRMESDLHNLYPSIGEVNKERSNYKYTEYLSDISNIESFGSCQMYISPHNHRAIIPIRSRGIAARAYLYMSYQYKILLDRNQLELYLKWDKAYPPNRNECLRNQLIAEVQGNENPFLTKKCTSDKK